MASETIYQIILSVLADEATNAERRTLAIWLDESESNRIEYEQIKRLYQVSTCQGREKMIDVDKAWKQIVPQTINKKRSLRPSSWLRYAAMIAILLATGVYFMQRVPRNTPQQQIVAVNMDEFDEPTLLLENGKKVALSEGAFSMQQKQVVIKNDADNTLVYESKQTAEASSSEKNNHLVIPKGKTYQLVLADGTRIWLNAETELTYPTHFTGKTREVTLLGEAYFEVSEDKEKPFVVKANGMEVKVLGTSFNVCCYNKDKVISTTLVEGSVSVRTDKGEQQTITPSEQFTFDRVQQQTHTQTVDTDLYTSWTNGVYIFKDATLESILDKLQRWYDFSVSYQDEKLKNKRFSITVDKQTTIDQLLEVISYTSEVKLERTEKNIHIKHQRREP